MGKSSSCNLKNCACLVVYKKPLRRETGSAMKPEKELDSSRKTPIFHVATLQVARTY